MSLHHTWYYRDLGVELGLGLRWPSFGLGFDVVRIPRNGVSLLVKILWLEAWVWVMLNQTPEQETGGDGVREKDG